ncbi:MAG: hypothetical protein LZF62_310047 [Nitrospira sp.]|nr:MAG: hypothetical protein LZF62_310047 [Nitrospira sp.]
MRNEHGFSHCLLLVKSDVSFESTTLVVCDVPELSRFDGEAGVRYEIMTTNGRASRRGQPFTFRGGVHETSLRASRTSPHRQMAWQSRLDRDLQGAGCRPSPAAALQSQGRRTG